MALATVSRRLGAASSSSSPSRSASPGTGSSVSGGTAGWGAAAANLGKDLARLWDQYVKYSTLHGIVYLSSMTVPRKERLVWLAAMVAMIGLAHFLVFGVIWGPRKYGTSTLIESTFLQPTQFPFPALSLCPLNKIRKRVALQLLCEYVMQHLGLSVQTLNKTTHAQLLSVLRALSYVELSDLGNIRRSVSLAGPMLHHLRELNVTDFMRKVLPTCEELFDRCLWHGMPISCCYMLELQQSEFGFCYSANSLTAIRRRTCEPKDRLSNLCMLHRTSGFGPGSGVMVFFKQLPDEEIVKYRTRRGIVVVLHRNAELPEPAAGFVVTANSSLTLQMAVSIDWTTADEDTLSLPIEHRKCHSDEEQQLLVPEGKVNWLALSGVYSAGTCLTQCKLEYVYRTCQCLPYMFYGTHHPVCRTDQLHCMQDLSATRLLLPPVGFPDDGLTRRGINCSHCLPPCEVVSYKSKTMIVPGIPGVSRAGSLDIFMDAREPTIKYRISLDYGLFRRLTIVGGTAGLCLGLSAVSVVEVIFYLARAVVLLAAFLRRGTRCLQHYGRRHRRRLNINRILVVPRRPAGQLT